jgi:uncharacterized protein
LEMSTLLQEERQAVQEEYGAATAGFRPHPLLRVGHIQTVALSYAARSCGNWLPGEQVIVVDAGQDETGYDEGVRLVGYYNEHQAEGPSRGLVISLHGWQGCSHSPHNLMLGTHLLAEGYDLFRLNLRDHGPSRHVDPYALNRGIFLGTLLAETHCAVQRVAAWARELPVFIVGPSLGGNFALRMGMRHATHPIHNLQRVVVISPAINPARATDRIDAQYPFRRYFRRRWLNSIFAKQRYFPTLYDVDALIKITRVRQMTDWLVKRYTVFHDADDYFAHYAVLGDALVGLTVPSTILTAADDPVITVEDFRNLTPTPMLDIKVEQYGGHVGFFDVWPLRHLLPEMVVAELRRS